MSRRTLVVRLDSVGDVLVCGPSVRAVANGSDEVWLLCGPQGAPAARLLPGVDQVRVWDCPWIGNPPRQFTRAAADELNSILTEAQPDEVIILTSFHQSPLPLAAQLRLAGIDRITGVSVDYAGSLLDVRLRPGEDLAEDQPEPLRALAIAAAAGFQLPSGDDGALRVLPPPDVSRLLPSGDFIAVHPGAAVPAREWPAGHHRRLVQLLAQRGVPVVVTGGPGERELTESVAGEHGIDLGGRTDLAELSGVLARAAVLVAGNTGAAHLAAAVRTPVVSLFSPVVPAVRWAPYAVPCTILGRQDAACAGSRARDCPIPGHPCLSTVTPEVVAEAALRLADRAFAEEVA